MGLCVKVTASVQEDRKRRGLERGDGEREERKENKGDQIVTAKTKCECFLTISCMVLFLNKAVCNFSALHFLTLANTNRDFGSKLLYYEKICTVKKPPHFPLFLYKIFLLC